MTDVQVVKRKEGKVTFEVLTKPGTVLKYRKGLLGSLDNVLLSDDVFLDYKKGERPSADQLSTVFGTKVQKDICKLIVENGELELTAAERKEAVDKKRAEIVTYIHKYYTDPKTKLPHPVLRIENALDQGKVKIDVDLPTEKQAQDAVKKINTIITLRKTEMGGVLTLPTSHVGAGEPILRKHAKVLSENWKDDGCEYAIEFLPGDYQTLLSELGKVTGGDFNFAIEGADAMAGEASSSSDSGGKKGKKGGAKSTSSSSPSSSSATGSKRK